METEIMSFSVNNELDVHSTSFDAFISYMDTSTDFWVIKDAESRFVYGNDVMLHYSGLPKGFDIKGKLDSECPAPWSEHEEVIQANDKNVMARKQTIPVLNTFTFGGKEKKIQPFLLEITPLIKEGRSIGIVGRGKKLEIYSMYHFENGFYPETLSFGPPDKLFTDQEFNVIFFTLQSMSAKEIAKKLNLSHRTIENKLAIIYQKIDINSLVQLKEYCRAHGYYNYAPTLYINPNSYIPLVS